MLDSSRRERGFLQHFRPNLVSLAAGKRSHSGWQNSSSVFSEGAGMKAVLVRLALGLALVGIANFAQAGLTDWWKPSPASSSSKSKPKSKANKPFFGSHSAKGGSVSKIPIIGTLSTSTKKAYTNTKAMLTPSKKKSTPKKLTGSRSKPKPARNDEKESTSVFGSFFQKEKEPEPPRSIKEWMSLPRLDP
jgi:hypothetical protein